VFHGERQYEIVAEWDDYGAVEVVDGRTDGRTTKKIKYIRSIGREVRGLRGAISSLMGGYTLVSPMKTRDSDDLGVGAMSWVAGTMNRERSINRLAAVLWRPKGEKGKLTK
jgi:hypothetical protein